MFKPFGTTFDYGLDDVYSLVRRSGSNKIKESRRVKPTFLDTFLFSGRFNSVLGLDGFQNFKEQLKDLIKKVNADEFGLNYINLDRMYEVLLASGVYYVDAEVTEDMSFMTSDDRWLTAYRYVAKNFSDLTYKDFREIVKRFKDSDGHSFYLEPSDTSSLLSISEKNSLFLQKEDARGALLQLSQKELKAICQKINISAARSIEDTAQRILTVVGERAVQHIPVDKQSRRTYFIKDLELASGQDLINLDSYLRDIANLVRDDLAEFIDKQREINFTV